MADLNLKIGGTLPGEQALVAVLGFIADLPEPLKTRLEAVMVQQIEDLQRVWRKLWQDAGIVPKDQPTVMQAIAQGTALGSFSNSAISSK